MFILKVAMIRFGRNENLRSPLSIIQPLAFAPTPIIELLPCNQMAPPAQYFFLVDQAMGDGPCPVVF